MLKDWQWSGKSTYQVIRLLILCFQFESNHTLHLGLKGKTYNGANGQKVVQLNDMFDVFKKVKGTPKYWQTAKYELVAKVKQLGPFHLFYTFSCGEMR